MNWQESDKMHDAAAAWVARMDSGEWTDADEADLQAWFLADPRHAGALLQMQASWIACDEAISIAEKSDGGPSASASTRLDRRTLIAAGGTALAASLAGGLIWVRSIQSYQTGVGEIRRIPLKDGSVAAVNTMSRIEVKLAESHREVFIDSGEAWFQVAKDPARPFVVAAGRVRAQAVGTAFSVRKRDSGADVVVTEGTVEAWADGAEGAKIQLVAGEGAFVANNAGVTRLPYAPNSPESSLAWRVGRIELVGESLASAATEFNRYNKRQIVIGDPSIGAELFDGVFRIDDPEGFALAVKSSLNVTVDFSDASQIFIGKRQHGSPST